MTFQVHRILSTQGKCGQLFIVIVIIIPIFHQQPFLLHTALFQENVSLRLAKCCKKSWYGKTNCLFLQSKKKVAWRMITRSHILSNCCTFLSNVPMEIENKMLVTLLSNAVTNALYYYSFFSIRFDVVWETEKRKEKGKSLPKKVLRRRKKVTKTVSSAKTPRVHHASTSPTRHYNFVFLLFFFPFLRLVLATKQELQIRVKFAYATLLSPLLAPGKCVSHLYHRLI